MTNANANTKRRNELKFDDEFDLPIAHPDPAMPERTLWCCIIRANVELARRGNANAAFWLNERSGVFEHVCALMGLSPTSIRTAVDALSVKQSRIRGVFFTQAEKRKQDERKTKAPALLCLASAVAAPLDGLNHAPAPGSAVQGNCGDSLDSVPDPTGWQTWL